MPSLHLGLDLTTLIAWISAFTVCYATAAAVQGYVKQKITVVERVLYAVVIIVSIKSGLLISACGWILFAGPYFFRIYQHNP